MIHVICADTASLNTDDYRMLYEKASPERRERADRYSHWEDSLRCVTADALLRHALGGADYTVEKAPAGKPYIKGKEGFFYNLSHAGTWVVIAFGNTEVGVDVEHHREKTRMESITRNCFTPEEQDYILQEKETLQQRFFEVWTAKESYLKYLGTGLQKSMRSFSVLSLEPPVRIHRRTLPGGYTLSLCTEEAEPTFSLLDARELL